MDVIKIVIKECTSMIQKRVCFKQLFTFVLCFSTSLPYPLHNSTQITAVKYSKYCKNIVEIRQYYQEQHQNWYVIDGFHSKWWVWNEAINNIKMVNRHMQIYLERIKAGKKALIVKIE